MSAPLPLPISLVNDVMILPQGSVEPNRAQPRESTIQSLMCEITSEGILLNESAATYSERACVGDVVSAKSLGCALTIGRSLTGVRFYDFDRFHYGSDHGLT